MRLMLGLRVLLAATGERSPNPRVHFYGQRLSVIPAAGNTVGNMRPGFSSVVCPEDMGTHVVEPERVDGGIGRLDVEMAGIEGRRAITLHPNGRCCWPDRRCGTISRAVVESCIRMILARFLSHRAKLKRLKHTHRGKDARLPLPNAGQPCRFS